MPSPFSGNGNFYLPDEMLVLIKEIFPASDFIQMEKLYRCPAWSRRRGYGLYGKFRISIHTDSMTDTNRTVFVNNHAAGKRQPTESGITFL